MWRLRFEQLFTNRRVAICPGLMQISRSQFPFPISNNGVVDAPCLTAGTAKINISAPCTIERLDLILKPTLMRRVVIALFTFPIFDFLLFSSPFDNVKLSSTEFGRACLFVFSFADWYF